MTKPLVKNPAVLTLAGAFVSLAAYFLGTQGIKVECPDVVVAPAAEVAAPSDAGVE